MTAADAGFVAMQVAALEPRVEAAVAAEVSMLTLDDLKSLQRVPSHYSDHNAALKHARDTNEYKDQATKEYDLHGMERIPVVVRFPDGGEACDYSETDFFDWRVQSMLSNLRGDDLETVVKGPAGRGGAIVDAICTKEHNAGYDHKCAVAERKGKANFQYQGKDKRSHELWDFIIRRDDGTRFWLHPSATNNDVHYGEVDENEKPQGPPDSGPGGSGKGVFKHYKNARTHNILKWDREKNLVRGPTRKHSQVEV